MERNASLTQIAHTAVMVHMLMGVPLAAVRAFLMEANARMVTVVVCVAPVVTIGTRLERCTVAQSGVSVTGHHVSRVKVVGSVAAEGPMTVTARFVVVNACRVDQGAVR
jgi:hypothetical protein